MTVGDDDNIIQKFKRLFTPISKDLKGEFYSTIAKENFVRIIFMSIIYILFEIRIMFTRIETDVLEKTDASLFMITFHIVFIIISSWLSFKKKHINGMVTQVIVNLYCAVLIHWSVNTSIGQVSRTGSITMFILTLTGISALFYRRSLITLITNLGFYFYFVFRINLIAEEPIIKQLRNLPYGNKRVGTPPLGNPHAPGLPAGRFPPGNPPLSNPVTFTINDANVYISDAFLMTVICRVLGIIIYRLRLKVFFEHKALEELAVKDSMTNLFNHKNICNSLEYEIKRSKQNSKPVSILMTDIDHFKQINDTYGHQTGDQVIIKIAKLLSETCRDTDYIGRYGGEEFLVVLTNTDEDGAKIFAERLRSEIEKMDFGIPVKVTVSGGVKTYEEESAEEMIKLADGALYQAKAKGRNCIVIA